MRRDRFDRRAVFAAILACAALPALAQTEMRFVDAPVTDSDGKTYRFARDIVAARPLILSFTYTGCQTLCPSMDITMDEVTRRLQGDAHKPTIATLTLDPLNDTPQVLAARAAAMAEGRVWLSGAPGAVYAILDGLNIVLGRLEDHDLKVFIVADGGRRVETLSGLASPDDILKVFARVKRQ